MRTPITYTALNSTLAVTISSPWLVLFEGGLTLQTGTMPRTENDVWASTDLGQSWSLIPGISRFGVSGMQPSALPTIAFLQHKCLGGNWGEVESMTGSEPIKTHLKSRNCRGNKSKSSRAREDPGHFLPHPTCTAIPLTLPTPHLPALALVVHLPVHILILGLTCSRSRRDRCLLPTSRVHRPVAPLQGRHRGAALHSNAIDPTSLRTMSLE